MLLGEVENNMLDGQKNAHPLRMAVALPQRAVYPPSTQIAAPLMKVASSDSSHLTA